MEYIIQKKASVLKSSPFDSVFLDTVFLICVLLCLGDLFNIAVLKYVDDIIGLLGLFFVFVYLIKGKFQKEIIPLFCVFLTGLVSALLSNIPRNPILFFADFFFIYKFAFIFLLVYDFTKKRKRFSEIIIRKYSLFSLLLIVVMFPICLIQRVNGAGRALFFSGYAGTVGLYSFLFFVIHSFSIKSKGMRNKKSFLYIVGAFLDVGTCLLSGSTTAEFFIGLFCLLYLFLKYKKRRFLLLIITVICLCAFVLVFKDKITGYFFNPDAPRGALYTYSFLFLKQYFPFGVGFSFFGGKIAADYYSPVYVLLGWKDTYILGENSVFLLDTYFPTIIGETGFVGILLFIYLITNLFKLISKKTATGIISFFLFSCLLLTAIPFNFINSGIGASFIFITIFFANFKGKENENVRHCFNL
jgi:hypothetical protein